MITIIAEKPSVARDVAKIVGANEIKDGFLTGNNYHVTYAFGHLVGLAEPTAYGYSEKWIKEELPLLPTKFELAPSDNAGAKKQLGIIKNLFKDSESIIVATDAGREGELIFRWIYEYLGISKPFKRLWISDMTDKSIQNGLKNLLEGRVKDNLYYAAKARAESDWLIGLNATRILTINNRVLLSLGRVQTPTLRLIVDRYLDNKNFTVSDFWKPFITIDNNNDSQKIKLLCDREFDTENEIKEFVNILTRVSQCNVHRDDKKENEKAPKLYSLTSLQKHANTKLNFTADQTLKILQSLYEKHKIVTYPRTDSEFLTENQITDVEAVLESHQKYFSENNVKFSEISKNPAFNNSKVTDHHAVIPTHIFPSNSILSSLSDDERNLYNMVIIRFYQRFSPDCEKEKTILSTEINDETFKYIHITEIFRGWKIYSNDVEPEEKNEQQIKFPIMIKDGQAKKILDHSYSKFQTKPKPIHNESSLLSAMEMAGKEIENEDLKEQMKGKGLGTPATRSGIIELLLTRKFIERKGKQLIPTLTGIDLIDKIRNHKISIPEWTAAQEFELYKVEQGEITYSSYINSTREITKAIISELDIVKVDSIQNTREKVGKCPKCKEGEIVEGKKGYGCTNYKASNCDFVIWKEVAKKKLSTSVIKKLITVGNTDLIKGFTSAKGSKFDAKLSLNNEFKVEFKFDQKRK